MARAIDVYQLVLSFAQRNNTSEFEYKTFLQAVQRQARLSDQGEPVFRDLAFNPDTVLIPKLFNLSREKKLVLQTLGDEIQSIILPQHFAEIFFQEYRRMDESADVPFPDEETLKVTVPGDWIQSISVETDLGSRSEATGGMHVPLYRVTFPQGIRSLVVPSSYLPGKLLEYAVLKLRQYLRKGANKEYMYNKLVNAFPGKENQLKEALQEVLTKHSDAAKGIQLSDSDFTFPFWAYFVSAIKKDLDKKENKTAEDTSYQQSAILCEFYVNYYKGKAQRVQDVEAAVKTLDVCIRKPPYYFTIEEILAFRDGKGAPVLGRLSHDELEARIKAKTTRAEDGALPELLVVAMSGKRVFVAKDRALLLAVKLIGEARSELRTRILDQWKRLIEDFESIPAMENDQDFLSELVLEVEACFPILDAMIRDRLLPLVRDEASARAELPPDLARLFYKDDLVSLDELLSLFRRSLLVDVRMLLPFWYSVPVFFDLARLLNRLAKRLERRGGRRAASAQELRGEARIIEKKPRGQKDLTSKERRAAFETAANRIAKELLPAGYGLEEYLLILEERWNTLLNPEAQKNLAYDVDCLARDYLRGVLRNMGGSSFTTARVKNLGSSLADSPSLLKIKNHQALELYLQLYLLKIVGARLDRD